MSRCNKHAVQCQLWRWDQQITRCSQTRRTDVNMSWIAGLNGRLLLTLPAARSHQLYRCGEGTQLVDELVNELGLPAGLTKPPALLCYRERTRLVNELGLPTDVVMLPSFA